jgi:ATP-dependent helicase HrpB
MPRPADIEVRLQALSGQPSGRLDKGALRRIRDTANQLGRRLGPTTPDRGDASAGSLLVQAFPDRVGRARDGHSGRYLLSNGRGALLPRGDALTGTPFIVAAHLDAGHADGRIFLAARITAGEIRQALGAHIRHEERVALDERSGAVVAHDVESLDAIVLSERQLARPSPDAVQRLLLARIRRTGLDTLAFGPAASELRTRVRCLHAWQPDAGWPDWSDEALESTLDEWLVPWLDGVHRLEDLQRIDHGAALRAGLDWDQLQCLDRLAPTHIRVPSGHRRRLTYSPGESPVLAVKLQELFGLGETPAVCDGRVPVLLHLLSPAGRPIQVTSDLKSFWTGTYPEVRKELKGRYPKHPWPEDPWNALPTAATKRRR